MNGSILVEVVFLMRGRGSKRSIDWNMPPKGVILSDFIRTFAILCFVSIENLFVFFSNTKISEFSDTTKSWVTFCCSGF